MQGLYNKYEIRLANECDIEGIMKFLDENWRSGHLLATDASFFRYEFVEDDGTVNFVIALNKETGEIDGLEGFLKASSDVNPDVWTSFWKVKDGSAPFLGIEIRRQLEKLSGCRHSLGIGDNPKTTIPIMRKIFNRKTARMKQYYMLSEKKTYKIASISNHILSQKPTSRSDREIIRITDINKLGLDFHFDNFRDHIPFKDAWYYSHKFLNNPIYNYEIYGIYVVGSLRAFFVIRVQDYDNRKAIRIVDFEGDQKEIGEMGVFISELLKQEEYEYADFFCYGYDHDHLIEAGFTMLGENDPNIIPNYFYPYVCENITIYVDYEIEGTTFCKGDSDQDRPNARIGEK